MTDSQTDRPDDATGSGVAHVFIARTRDEQGNLIDPDLIKGEIRRQLEGEPPGPLGQPTGPGPEPTVVGDDRIAFDTVLTHQSSPDNVPPEVLADAEAKVRALAEKIRGEAGRTFAYANRDGEVINGYGGLTDV
ncbi:hypothetical protein, partial [Glutamicibacter sp. V16R2B1]|uniref:hypothetical protein n=1 Tax=Glutamicibacter sp. V16R2B1 TaxID=2036207 RepID=UPI0010FD89FC